MCELVRGIGFADADAEGAIQTGDGGRSTALTAELPGMTRDIKSSLAFMISSTTLLAHA